MFYAVVLYIRNGIAELLFCYNFLAAKLLCPKMKLGGSPFILKPCIDIQRWSMLHRWIGNCTPHGNIAGAGTHAFYFLHNGWQFLILTCHYNVHMIATNIVSHYIQLVFNNYFSYCFRYNNFFLFG